MAYSPNIPGPNDLLSNSQQDIKNNFTSANTTFGIDHYAFDNLTVNVGKHNKITTPLIVGSAHPTTIAAEPKFYAMQDIAAAGVLQYSRGPSDAAPTPLTKLQSPTAGVIVNNGATTNVFNFTGLTLAHGALFVTATTNPPPGVNYLFSTFFWDGTTLVVTNNSLAGLAGQVSVTTLQVKNNTASPRTLWWTLDFYRMQK